MTECRGYIDLVNASISFEAGCMGAIVKPGRAASAFSNSQRCASPSTRHSFLPFFLPLPDEEELSTSDVTQAHFTLTTFNPLHEFALVAENRAAMLQWVTKLQDARSYFHATQNAAAFKRPAKHILGHAMPNLIMGVYVQCRAT